MNTALQLDSLVRGFDDLFYGGIDSFMNDFLNSTTGTRQMYPVTFPPCNVYIDKETKDLKMEFAIAGIPQEWVSMDIDGDYLYLDIDPQKETEEKSRYTLVQKGIKTGSSKQKFYIPASKYSTDKAQATIKDGLLTVEIPAKKEMAKKKLEITTE